MIILNTPHNPVGKVFTRRELEYIAKLAIEFNLLVLSDEVVGLHSSYNYMPLVEDAYCSMTAWCLAVENISESQPCPVCGSGPSL